MSPSTKSKTRTRTRTRVTIHAPLLAIALARRDYQAAAVILFLAVIEETGTNAHPTT